MLRLFFIFVFVQISIASAGQEVFKGIIVDSATYLPLPNVSIKIKKHFRGTITDTKGNFSIQATYNDTLLISLLGYKPLEFPLFGYEPSLILLTEKETLLAPIVIQDSRLYSNPYTGMFDEQREQLRKRIPFYYSKAKKEKIKVAGWREQSIQVQTYVEVVISDPSTKEDLMQKYHLTEEAYYKILTSFNEEHYKVMYFLNKSELLSLINKYFEARSSRP